MARVKGDKYNKKFTKQLRNGLREDGKSITKVCKLWDITRNTYNYWVDHYPEFKEAHEYGNRDFIIFLEDLAMDVASGKTKGNAGVLIFSLKNAEALGWRDQVEVTSNPEQIHKISINILPAPVKALTHVIEHERP